MIDRSRPAYRDYLGMEETDKPVMHGQASAGGNSVVMTVDDKTFRSFKVGEVYRVSINGGEAEDRTAYLFELSGDILLASTDGMQGDMINACPWLIAPRNGVYTLFNNGSEDVSMRVTKRVKTAKYDLKRLDDDLLPESVGKGLEKVQREVKETQTNTSSRLNELSNRLSDVYDRAENAYDLAKRVRYPEVSLQFYSSHDPNGVFSFTDYYSNQSGVYYEDYVIYGARYYLVNSEGQVVLDKTICANGIISTKQIDYSLADRRYKYEDVYIDYETTVKSQTTGKEYKVRFMLGMMREDEGIPRGVHIGINVSGGMSGDGDKIAQTKFGHAVFRSTDILAIPFNLRASETDMGLIRAPEKTESDTQPVRIDPDTATLWTAPPPETVTPDWEQNDKNAADYIKNRPFYHFDGSSVDEYSFASVAGEGGRLRTQYTPPNSQMNVRIEKWYSLVKAVFTNSSSGATVTISIYQVLPFEGTYKWAGSIVGDKIEISKNVTDSNVKFSFSEELAAKYDAVEIRGCIKETQYIDINPRYIPDLNRQTITSPGGKKYNLVVDENGLLSTSEITE